ncbi:sushi, von Willebrand factor type A, EGF and pentraxin domain-containing protein 1-like [Pocillopora verrucosa]|uniref:sushi, von Willebrand factor type A, EGF and pentraxin domain-containing protein 1-like n=1 Tax=Pocillopora verrucosa TaxID=203993 RepID=UPI0033426447
MDFICVRFISLEIFILLPMIARSQDEDRCRHLDFKAKETFDGKRLVNHVIRIAEVTVKKFCEAECFMEPYCVSFNLDKRTDGNEKYKCELNDVTHERHEDDWKEDENFFHVAAENACLESPCKNNAPCQSGFTDKGYRCLCPAGYKGPTCDEASTCQEAFERNTSISSGMVTLYRDSKAFLVYCHMGNFGCGDGGWTTVMKIDGHKKTFHYDSPYWSNKVEYMPSGGDTGFDSQETKLITYWNTSFSKICLGMNISQQINFIVINKKADSLYSLIADGKYRSTSVGRDTWKTLVGSQASLQLHCNMEGFNSRSQLAGSKTRIGILGNNEHHCQSPDSRIGFGMGGGPDDSNTCGNEAAGLWGADNGNRKIKAMGYILVQ